MAFKKPGKGGWIKVGATLYSRTFSTAIDGQFRGDGDAIEFAKEVLAVAEAHAQTAIKAGHVRSGELLEGLKNAGALHSGPYAARGFLYNTAPHALFVEKGTKGPIYPHGEFLLVPRHKSQLPLRHGGKNLERRSSVRGQAAQEFMGNAMRHANKTRAGWRPRR
jgi:hypothetical protein